MWYKIYVTKHLIWYGVLSLVTNVRKESRMIVSLKYENLRHGSREFTFDRIVSLEGANGLGKSSVIDATAFAWTGCDAQGNPLPVHLITEGKDKMYVALDTGKVLLERTLTAKKNSTLKMTIAGRPPQTLTQSDLAKYTASKDSFLSACIAGYFMKLPESKKLAVLEEFVPKQDKAQVVAELFGRPVPMHIAPLIDYAKRSETNKTKLASKRLEQQRELDHRLGAIEAHNEAKAPEGKEIVLDFNLLALMNVQSAWTRYDTDYLLYQNKVSSIKQNEVDWDIYRQKKSELEAQIRETEAQFNKVIYSYDELNAELQKLRNSLKAEPQPPQVHSDVSQDLCPTCGQTVRIKHREKVAAQNAELRAKYEAELEEVKEFNHTVYDKVMETTIQVEALRNREKEVKDQNARVAERLFALKSQLASLTKPAVIPEPVPPVQPAEPRMSTEEYEAKRAQYLAAQEHNSKIKVQQGLYNESVLRRETLAEGCSRLEEAVKEYADLEEVFSKLDNVIFERNRPYYSLTGGYQIVQTDEEVTIEDKDKKPYSVMSTGEKIRADIFICEKIANNLPKKVKFIFVDNEDLLSEDVAIADEKSAIASVSVDIEQLFTCNVTHEQLMVCNKSITGSKSRVLVKTT